MGIPGGVKLFQTRIQAGLGMMVHRNRVLEQALKADRIYRRCPMQSAKASVRIGASGHYPQRTWGCGEGMFEQHWKCERQRRGKESMGRTK